jgi:hypothetical protein
MTVSYTTPPTLVKVLTGHTLARNGYSKSQRAGFAAGVACGEINYTKPTLKQLAKLFNVSVPYIEKALALSPMERSLLRGGCIEIAGLPPSPAELARTVGRAGIDRVWGALCDQL